jgi:hypothetical protein
MLGFSFLYIFANMLTFIFLIIAILIGMRRYYILIFISVMIIYVRIFHLLARDLFIYLLLKKLLFKSFTHFLIICFLAFELLEFFICIEY